jgi:hypothetical protein
MRKLPLNYPSISRNDFFTFLTIMSHHWIKILANNCSSILAITTSNLVNLVHEFQFGCKLPHNNIWNKRGVEVRVDFVCEIMLCKLSWLIDETIMMEYPNLVHPRLGQWFIGCSKSVCLNKSLVWIWSWDVSIQFKWN